STLSTPKLVMRAASGVERLLRRDKAKLTADRVSYFCHPDWVVTAKHRPPPWLWTPQVRTPTGLKQTAEWYLAQGWLR
ncbi:MAG TPA: NAD(P)-dependent oxidoreductase, partial [Allosphingosinicella sp.]|nr:NAD(P)-dependent oxidoreductase [Allosphingosinicella sp.]